MSIEKNINRLFQELETSKKSINEILSDSSELLGGNPVRIPTDGAHAGQSGWASGNAWDIAAAIGTPVYAIASGVATTFSDYGPNVIAKDGKKLFGQSFTVQSNDGLPSVYYTHLTGSPIRKGSEVSCGEFLGVIMDFPGSSYDHVHIGVESGNIRQFLNDDGTLKCASGQQIDGTTLDTGALGGLAMGGAAVGGAALAASAVTDSGSNKDSFVKSDDLEFMSKNSLPTSDKFEFFEYLKSKKISENIERIKKML
jgi:murein DD-endopeptidase MepM/ murein hydrolase activator NlpD